MGSFALAGRSRRFGCLSVRARLPLLFRGPIPAHCGISEKHTNPAALPDIAGCRLVVVGPRSEDEWKTLSNRFESCDKIVFLAPATPPTELNLLPAAISAWRDVGKFQQVEGVGDFHLFHELPLVFQTKCGFPGSALAQYGILFATALAMSATCMAISAYAKSPERASLLSIYLVGFQMPLSGAALALPDWLNGICRPFIAAYWGWSGYLKTFEATRHYDIVKQSTKTAIASYDMSVAVLGFHVLLSVAAAIYFSRRNDSITRSDC